VNCGSRRNNKTFPSSRFMCLSQHCRYLMKTFETRQIKLKLTSYFIPPPRRFEWLEFWNKGSKRWMCASISNSPSPLRLCLRTLYRPDHLGRHRWFCYVVSVPFRSSKKTTGSYVGLPREVRVASRGQEVASQGVRFTCISCVPSCQPQTWRAASRG
jgi:hypothetical protein